MVDMYITASQFGRQKLIRAGIDGKKIAVKPNFIYPDPGESGAGQRKRYALYIGRLSAEKGVNVLLESWRALPDFSLRIIGDGELSGALKDYVRRHNMSNVEFCGYVDQKEYDRNMREAGFLVVPSVCYENFPRVVAEAFAYGVPVLASRLASLEEIIEDKGNGMLFEAGNPSDLIQKAQWLIGHGNELERMAARARATFEQKYSARQNYEQLMTVYKKVMAQASPAYALN